MSSIQFDSPEEKMFYNWCIEAKAHGIIRDFIFHPLPIEIFPKSTYELPVKLKTKTRYDQKTLLNPLSYTSDFYIVGDLSAYHKPKDKVLTSYGRLDDRFLAHQDYYIDIKGSYQMHNDGVKFSVLQKVLWHHCGIYVNKLIPDKFFLNSWLPQAHSNKDDPIWTNSSSRVASRKRARFSKILTLAEIQELN